jgi:hypothetical protein
MAASSAAAWPINNNTGICSAYHTHKLTAGKRSTAPVIPLCPEHHRGNTGIHGLGRKGFERRYDVTEDTLLQIANDILSIQQEG